MTNIIAIVSFTANVLQNDIGTCFGPYIIPAIPILGPGGSNCGAREAGHL